MRSFNNKWKGMEEFKQDLHILRDKILSTQDNHCTSIKTVSKKMQHDSDSIVRTLKTCFEISHLWLKVQQTVMLSPYLQWLVKLNFDFLHIGNVSNAAAGYQWQ